MTVLVGRVPGREPGPGALVLGARLARVLGGPLVVCTVTSPGESRDAAAVEPAPAVDGVEVETTVVEDRSVPGGLARAAHAQQAAVIVLGDAPPGPGSVGARLARSADVPVALAGDTAVHDGPVFAPEGLKPQYQGFVRLNFATSRPLLIEALERMADALGETISA